MAAPVCQPEWSGSFLRADPARISFTSRQLNDGLTARARAPTPAACGAAALVPPKRL